jgi:hypothetical protein
VDGMTVEYAAEGWDFTLTSPRDCSAAQLTMPSSAPGDDRKDSVRKFHNLLKTA